MKDKPQCFSSRDASEALPLRAEGRGGTHHILDGWGSTQESVQGNGHGGGLWSPRWGMPEEKGTEKGRGFWHSRPSWSPFSLLDCGERPALGQVPPRPPSVQASRACATAPDETSAPSLNRHLIYASGDFLTSSNLRILRCKVAKECLLYGATERTGVLPPKKDFLVFLSCTESANEDCDEYAFWDIYCILTHILDPVGNSEQFGEQKAI